MHNLTLAAIVKNEASNIIRCLSSVSKYIDYYVICDTGSTDGTQEIIKAFFAAKGIPGELHEHAWEDFGTNRTKALDLCRGKTEWVIMLDADDNIEGEFPKDKLDSQYDGYSVTLHKNGLTWDRVQIFNLKNKEWHFVEPLHEYPTATGPLNLGYLTGDFQWIARCEGCRTNSSTTEQEKYWKDFVLLRSYLDKDPQDARKSFYAAQSAFDAGMFKVAEQQYLHTIELKGWFQEAFFSWYKVGKCRINNKDSLPNIMDAFLKAVEVDPTRVESVHSLSCYLRGVGRDKTAYLLTMPLIDHKAPKGGLFVENYCYDWGILDEVGTTAYYAGDYETGKRACERLLSEGKLPEYHKPRVENNLKIYEKQLKIG